MIKVLHLTTHLNTGGITSYILKLGKPLRKLGVEISVLSSGGECLEKYRAASIPTYEIPIKTKSELSPRLWIAAPAIKKILLRERFDLIHAHTRVTQVLGGFLSRITGIPMVTTCHGFYKKRLGRILLPAWGKRVIAISDGVAEFLIKDFLLPENRVVTVNNGVDVELIASEAKRYSREQAKLSYGFDPLDPVVGVVARLVEDKGQFYLLHAIANLKKEIPDIRLLIVGDGRCRTSFEKLSHDLGLLHNVVFCGNVDDVILPLVAMDIFALPATWREGFGLSIAEAMAIARPVVVTNIWSLNTLIQDQKTGILVPPKNIPVLTNALRDLFKDPIRAQAIGEAGKTLVMNSFGLERMASEIADVYRKVLAKIP